MFEQVSFQQPLALLLIPSLWLLIVLALLSRRRLQQWEHLIERSFHRKLLIALPASGRFWPSILLGLASLCLALALSQPQLSRQTTSTHAPASLPLVILLPLTEDSLRRDSPPSRLLLMQTQAQLFAEQRLPAQSALVAYAASAHTLAALNDDPVAMHSLLQAAQPELMPMQGQNAAAAVELAQQLLQQGRQLQGEILLYTNQLSHAEQQQIRNSLRHGKHRLTIISAGNHQELEKFSRKHNYQHLPLQQARHSYQPATSQQGKHSNHQQDHGYWLLPVVLLLLAPLARKGWLLALPLLLFVHSEHSLAQESQDAVMWQAIAAYEAHNYQQASQLFASLDGAVARYNQANALMHLGQFEQAIILYQQALQLEPQLSRASANLQLAQQMRQQQLNNEQARQQSQHSLISGEQQQPQPEPDNQQPQQPQVDLDTWLRQIPDQPGELFKQVFWYEYIDMEQQP